jgi:hypothetical protein
MNTLLPAAINPQKKNTVTKVPSAPLAVVVVVGCVIEKKGFGLSIKTDPYLL